MILYQLRCRGGHQFESWFRNSETYERQEKRGLLACPDCGSPDVEKAIMAPRIGKASAAAAVAAPEAPSEGATTVPAPATSVKGMMPDKMRAMLGELRRQVEANCDYVGGAFAEEARKIHYGEREKRSIYGETSEPEAEALREEGIEFGRIPWVPRGN